MKNKQEVSHLVGSECRKIRKQMLKMNLNTFSRLTNINLKTLSNFENGRSSNLFILYIYLYQGNKISNKPINCLIDWSNFYE